MGLPVHQLVFVCRQQLSQEYLSAESRSVETSLVDHDHSHVPSVKYQDKLTDH